MTALALLEFSFRILVPENKMNLEKVLLDHLMLRERVFLLCFKCSSMPGGYNAFFFLETLYLEKIYHRRITSVGPNRHQNKPNFQHCSWRGTLGWLMLLLEGSLVWLGDLEMTRGTFCAVCF